MGFQATMITECDVFNYKVGRGNRKTHNLNIHLYIYIGLVSEGYNFIIHVLD